VPSLSMVEMSNKTREQCGSGVAWIVLIWRGMHTSCPSSGALSHTIETIRR
jgi:hypothetical protein